MLQVAEFLNGSSMFITFWEQVYRGRSGLFSRLSNGLVGVQHSWPQLRAKVNFKGQEPAVSRSSLDRSRQRYRRLGAQHAWNDFSSISENHTHHVRMDVC